jgi:RimJ/RimL family protein N-acetyltransferase
MAEFAIETERLILREWRDGDVVPLLAICTDPRVMAFLGPLQTEGDVRGAIARQRGHQNSLGHCYWAIERKTDSEMIGFCGLQPEPEAVPVIGGLPDIGWRLAHGAWGKGYALEAATASLDWGFANLADEAIWAITVPGNTRSWGLMERLGMTRHHDLDFDHPHVPDGSPLKPHITYSIRSDQWPRTP